MKNGAPLALAVVAALALASRKRGSRKVASPSPQAVAKAVMASLSDDLRKHGKAGRTDCPACGHCYVASEAAWHLLGGSTSGWVPASGTWKGVTHWWLENDDGQRLDITASQFPKGFPYDKGQRRGFLTGSVPSQRAQIVIERASARLSKGSRSRKSRWTDDEARARGSSWYAVGMKPRIGPEKLDWRYERCYPVSSLMGDGGRAWWRSWLHSEDGWRSGNSSWLDEFSRWWKTDPESEPVVIIEDQKGSIIGVWDGRHRIGVTLSDSRSPDCVPAFVGRADAWVRRGSAYVDATVADSGYHRTAIATTGMSAPMRHLVDRHPSWVKGSVLDFGSGRGRDCTALGRKKGVSASCYDPHHPQASRREKPTGKHDLVSMIYVVNVLPKAERNKALRQAGALVKKGGRIAIAARGEGDSQGVSTAKGWTKHSDGHAEIVNGEIRRFQRFWDRDTLLRESLSALGRQNFVPEDSLVPMSADTALVVLRRTK